MGSAGGAADGGQFHGYMDGTGAVGSAGGMWDGTAAASGGGGGGSGGDHDAAMVGADGLTNLSGMSGMGMGNMAMGNMGMGGMNMGTNAMGMGQQGQWSGGGY
jgi:hypothetical protein